MTDYDEACQRATTNQGLDPVLAALSAANLRHGLEQTGGFTMVVTVPYPDGTLGITQDTPPRYSTPEDAAERRNGEGGTYLLVDYPGDTWSEGGEEAFVAVVKTLDTLVKWTSVMQRGEYQR